MADEPNPPLEGGAEGLRRDGGSCRASRRFGQKRRFCTYFPDIEMCREHRGGFCNFAHKREEIQAPLLTEAEEKQEPSALSDDFFMYKYKTLWCPIGVLHDWHTCVYAHNYQDARRPVSIGYGGRLCPYWSKADSRSPYQQRCPFGYRCPYSHGAKEQLYHPHYYKTVICRARHGKVCPRRNRCCAFFHSKSDRRASPDDRLDYSQPLNQGKISQEWVRDFLSPPFPPQSSKEDGMMQSDGNGMIPYYPWEGQESTSMVQVEPYYMFVAVAQPYECSFDAHPDMFMWEGGSEAVFESTMTWLQPEAEYAVCIDEQTEGKKTSRSESSTPLTSDISTCDTASPSAQHGSSTIGKQLSSEDRINWADVSEAQDNASDSESCHDWASAVRDDPYATDINEDPRSFDGTEASSEQLHEYLSKTLQTSPTNEPGAEFGDPQPAQGEEYGTAGDFSEVIDEEAAYRQAREAAAYHEAMLKSVLQAGINVEATLEPNFWAQYLRS